MSNRRVIQITPSENEQIKQVKIAKHNYRVRPLDFLDIFNSKQLKLLFVTFVNVSNKCVNSDTYEIIFKKYIYTYI